MRLWILVSILEVRLFGQSLFKERSDLAFEIRLTSKNDQLTNIFEEIERRLTFVITGQAETMTDNHLPDKVILSVFDDT